MKFLVDAQLPPALCRWLEARGHEAMHIAEALPGATPDRLVAAHAARLGMVLVTKDEDFLLRFPPEDYVLLWLRCGNCTNTALSRWLSPRWEEIERLLAKGERLVEVR